ncbi:hypothetical protein V8J88_22760 [Massilia sp. W12]|uniref:hypothetical protein n=1 Tax=Massilia sp. W12 TaxID=3126507 RepID=UPI0030CF1DB2
MEDKIKQLITRTLVAKAFAKKAPVLGAIIASEDVLKKLQAAGSDWLSGHPEGAKNELQQAVTHAVGAGVNFIGGLSLIGMTGGLVAQAMAQRHAQQIAEKKPPHPKLDDSLLSKVKQTADKARKVKRAVDSASQVADLAQQAGAAVSKAAGAIISKAAQDERVSRVVQSAASAAGLAAGAAQAVARAGRKKAKAPVPAEVSPAQKSAAKPAATPRKRKSASTPAAEAQPPANQGKTTPARAPETPIKRKRKPATVPTDSAT